MLLQCVDLAHLMETARIGEDEIMRTVVGTMELIVIVLTGVYIQLFRVRNVEFATTDYR